MDPPERPASSRPFRVRRGVIIAAAVLVVAAAAGAYVFVQRRQADRPLILSGQSQAARQVVSLREYAARAPLGSLVPQTDAILAIREEFLQRVVDQSLPLRQYFQNGQYVARLDSAAVWLESGLAVVTLAGRGMVAGQEGSPLYADLLLQGLINITGVDPEGGTLQASLVITDVRAKSAKPEDLQTLINPVAGYFGRLSARDWNQTGQTIHLPLRVDREFILPAIDGDVTVPESRVPISVRVSAVTTLHQRMAVSLALLPDTGSGEKNRPPDKRWNSRPALVRRLALRIPHWGPRGAEQESLQIQVDRLARRDPLWKAVAATDHDVVMVVPGSVVRTVTTRVTRRYLKGVAVDVRPEAIVRLDNVLRVKVFGGKMGVGRLTGTIHISHLKGMLSVAGAPSVTFEPPHEVAISAPIRLLAGRGSVNMNMEWKPAYLVSALCHDFHFNETLEGTIVPFAEDLTTRIRYTVRDESIVGWPRVQRDTIRFGTDLTDGSWTKVRDKLVEQDKFSRCGMVMNADSTLVKLRALAGRGIKVRLPPRVFKPFLLPVMLEGFYTAGEYKIEAQAFDPAIEVGPEYLRLAFRANLRVSSHPDTTQKPVPTGVPAPQTSAPKPSGPAAP